MIKNMIKDGCSEGGISLLNITDKVLAKILEYYKKHAYFVEASPLAMMVGPAPRRTWLRGMPTISTISRMSSISCKI